MNVPTRPNDPYPTNSDRSKEKKTIEPVAKARIKRESTARKVVGEIIREDARSVGETVLWDVIIPTVKNLISDTVTRGIESMLYGGDSLLDRGLHIPITRGILAQKATEIVPLIGVNDGLHVRQNLSETRSFLTLDLTPTTLSIG